MLGKTDEQLLRVEPFAKYLIVEHEDVGYVAFHHIVPDAEVVVGIEHIEHLDGLLVGDVVLPESH